MATLRTTGFLRRILLVDALATGATGLLMGIGAPALQDGLGIPSTLLRLAGWSLLPFAGLLTYLARRDALARGTVVAVIAANAAWVAASVLILVAGAVQPTALGYAFVLVQAAAVAVLAEMEMLGLRRAS